MQPSSSNPSPGSPTRRLIRRIIPAIIAAAVVVLVIIGLVSMVQAGATATVRDVFIIVMAVVLLFMGGLLLALVYQVAALTKMLREEIKPLLENAQETVNTARGTTMFVSDHVVRPVIGMAGAIAGIVRVVSLLGELRRPRR